MNDPIHPNGNGFVVLMAKFYQDWLKGELEGEVQTQTKQEQVQSQLDEYDEEAMLEKAMKMSMEQQ